MGNGKAWPAPKYRGSGIQTIIVQPLFPATNERKCKACGAKTQTPLRKWCEPCRKTLTADQKRAFYA